MRNYCRSRSVNELRKLGWREKRKPGENVRKYLGNNRAKT